MKKVSIILFAALLAAACAKDPFARKIHEGSALGYPVKQIDLEAEAGEKVVSVISNREYAILCDAGWLSVPASAPAGRDGFRLGYAANNALPRKAEVIVSIEETNHKDTLVVRQKSKESPRLSAATNVISLKGSAGGKMNLSLDTNIPDDEISLEYECEGGWISNIKLSGGTLTFDYDANPEEFVRRARASLSYTDVFDREYRIDFQISQMSSADSSGDELTLPELFALASEEVGESRWFNAVAVMATPDQIARIEQLPFVSRTQRIDVPPLSVEDLTKALMERRGLDRDTAVSVARVAGGSWLKALKQICDADDSKAMLQCFILLMRLAYVRDLPGLMKWSEGMTTLTREQQKAYLSYMQQMLRENFIYNFGRSELNFMTPQEADFAYKFARFINERNIIRFAEEFAHAQRDVAGNVNGKTIFFNLALQTIILLRV